MPGSADEPKRDYAEPLDDYEPLSDFPDEADLEHFVEERTREQSEADLRAWLARAGEIKEEIKERMRAALIARGPTCNTDEMRRLLRGMGLESRLEGGSLDAQIQKYVSALAEGPRGFKVDPATLRFPSDAQTLRRLEEGLTAGAINGVVVLAYPTHNQLYEIAHRVNPTRWKQEYTRLERETALEFLVKHLAARDGSLGDALPENEWLRELDELAAFKWTPKQGQGGTLWSAFYNQLSWAAKDPETAAHRVRKAWRDPVTGGETAEYTDDHLFVYSNRLDEQPKLVDVLSTASAIFTNVSRDVDPNSPILGADGVSEQRQGEGLSFTEMILHKLDSLTLPEYLALVSAMSTPGDASTYPDKRSFTLLASINEEDAMLGVNGEPLQSMLRSTRSDHRLRVRSVVR